MSATALATVLSMASPASAVFTAHVNFRGIIASSTIAGINVGDYFRADMTLTYEPAGIKCQPADYACGAAGEGYALFSFNAVPINGVASDRYLLQAPTPPDRELYNLFGFTSHDGTVSSAADESTQTGVYADSRGTLTFAAINVPEPTIWAMMLAGFGLIGAALRRGRSVSPLAPAV